MLLEKDFMMATDGDEQHEANSSHSDSLGALSMFRTISCLFHDWNSLRVQERL